MRFHFSLVCGGCMTVFIKELLSACDREYSKFRSGTLKEYDAAVYKRVGDYWKAINIDNIDGKTLSKDKHGKFYNPAWSSAFVSFVVKNAGAGDLFNYSSAHCHYIESARKARQNGTKSAYYAVSPDSDIPSPGDIICSGREYASEYSFENAELAYKTDSFYPSHGDVVIYVNREQGYLITIGGNVGNSVKQKKILIDEKGFLVDRVDGNNLLPWLALLKCQL
ncbi:hypothetical protein CQW29_04410 [Pantoea coffeiphila]|uniref:DUF2272 domain-containing protein n=2 Tax=Enterobacterales TaxID=91347 RepID=A0A2S9IGK7_9GAMM|nr:hypothetical protein CQW29_04410 [Pantoea coffeiphila]